MSFDNVRRAPYVVGRPITEQKLFFGRQGLFDFLKDNLEQNVKVLLLHGQRRIGKSSFLRQIPNFITEGDFKFIFFDLQDKSQLPLSQILHDLARAIAEYLQLESQVAVPTYDELKNDLDLFSQSFLPEVYQRLNGKNLVLLLDEFDVLNTENPVPAEKQFFRYLASLVRQEEKLFIVPVIGRKIDDLPTLLSLFKDAPNREIDLLDDVDAWRLIRRTAENLLEYEDDAIRAILEQSAGHPYLTQAICLALFGQAREQNNWRVTRQDVGEDLLDRAIEQAQGGLGWFWEGLPIPEQIIFSTVAEAQERAGKNRPEPPLAMLKEHGIVLTEELERAVISLSEIKYLDKAGSTVRVELVRRWLIDHHPFSQEILALEKLNDDAERSYDLADRRMELGDRQYAQELYGGALTINPNHISALFKLADIYLDKQEFDKATELYTRAYRINPIRAQESYLQALLGYGKDLFRQGKFASAKEQFEKILAIDSEHIQAKERVQEIEAIERNSGSRRPLSVRTLLISAFLGGPALMGLGIWLGRQSCPPGQTGIGAICWTASSSYHPWLSGGQRSLLAPASSSPKREAGIDRFLKGDYANALELLKASLVSHPNDPEALIYKNNALAKLKGTKPLTLAVVVPASGTSKTSASEMLRGVAQAQNIFNDDSQGQAGINGRLLEILIADDGNDPKRSPEVAQVLAENDSVLGVIGHNSSEASLAALPEYEKAQLAMISPTSSSTALKHKTVFYRTIGSDQSTGTTLAKYVKQTLRLQRVAIFYSGEGSHGSSLKESFEAGFNALGGQVLKTFNLSDPNLIAKEAIATSLRAKAEAGLLFSSTNDIDRAIKIARANNDWTQKNDQSGLKLLGGQSIYRPQTLDDGGEAVEGLVLAVSWVVTDPPQPFVKEAEALWGAKINWRTAASFDATEAFIAALKLSKDVAPDTLRSAVLTNLPEIQLPPEQTSSNRRLRFNANGEISNDPVLVEVNQGQFRLLKP